MSRREQVAELDVRQRLLDSLLGAPHGALEPLLPLYAVANTFDPRFVTHLAAWYAARGGVRDHLTLLLGTLFRGTREQREAATVLMQPLRTFQVNTLVQHVKRHLGGVPRAMRSAVTYWLRRREANPVWWEECCLRNRAALKSLYAGLHVRPSPLAQAVLFEDDAPEGSRLEALRLLRALFPHEVPAVVRRHRLPFQAVTGAVRDVTPAIAEALLEVMTAPQLVANLDALRRAGLLEGERLVTVRERLLRGVRDRLLTEGRLLRVARQLELPPDLVADLKRVVRGRLEVRGTLDAPTAILVDVSGSMEAAIDAGLTLAALGASVATSALSVFTFNDRAREVKSRGRELSDWEDAFRDVRADGSTSIGAGVEALLEARRGVEQLVLITDGQENMSPTFERALGEYAARHGEPRVTWLQVGNVKEAPLAKSLLSLRRPALVLRVGDDLQALANVVPLLSAGGRRALMEEIEATPVPTRDALANLPPGFDEVTMEIL